MSRLPFNADDAAGADASDPDGTASDGRRPLTVTELSSTIRRAVEAGVPAPIRVVGEIGNMSARSHWYFTLKDDTSAVSCVAWASDARRFDFVPREGDAVVATGSVSYYGPQGRTQLYVKRLEPAGEGALMARFRALCEEMRGAGLFDDARKRPLPAFARRIAVITSLAGAARHDVIETARSRCPAVGLLVVDARVQGEGAAESVAQAIRRVDARREALGIDAILVTRGGGSLEDLWAFNERVVADAVLACALPVVAAIGHESDTTIIELVADRRASTPTQAAVLLVPDRVDLSRQVAYLAERLHGLARRRVERARERLERLSSHALFRHPRAPIELVRERLDALGARLLRAAAARGTDGEDVTRRLARRLHIAVRAMLAPRRSETKSLSDRLHHAGRARVRHERERLDVLARRLDAIDPHVVLRRGFSYTVGPSGLVRRAGDVRAGDPLVTHLADGEVASIVGGSAGADQLDLFGGDR